MGLAYSLIEKSVLRKPGSTANINQVLTDAKTWMEELQAATSLSNYYYYATVTDSDTKEVYNVYPDVAVAYFNLGINIIQLTNQVASSSTTDDYSLTETLTNKTWFTKPVYRKVFKLIAPSILNTWVNTGIIIVPNIDEVMSQDVYLQKDLVGNLNIHTFINGNTSMRVNNSGEIGFFITEPWKNNKTIIATFEYTKI